MQINYYYDYSHYYYYTNRCGGRSVNTELRSNGLIADRDCVSSAVLYRGPQADSQVACLDTASSANC